MNFDERRFTRMNGKLSNSLAQFISSNKESFDNPFQEESAPVITPKFIEEQDQIRKEKKRKSKKNSLQALYEQTFEMFDDDNDDDMINNFDEYLDDYLLDDEDTEFRHSLIRYGRKYARDTKVSGEASEIQKAYAANEDALDKLLKEIEEDKENLKKYLKQMRANRTRNYNALSKMVEQRTTLHNATLGIIKESYSMKKNQMELKMKLEKNKQEEDAGD